MNGTTDYNVGISPSPSRSTPGSPAAGGRRRACAARRSVVGAAPALHGGRIDGRVVRPWKTWTGCARCAFEASYRSGVRVELVVDRHHPAVAVVEHVEAVPTTSTRRGRRSPSSLRRIAVEVERRRQQHEAMRSAPGAASAACTATKPPRLDPIDRDRLRRLRSIASSTCCNIRVTVSVEKSGWLRSGTEQHDSARGELAPRRMLPWTTVATRRSRAGRGPASDHDLAPGLAAAGNRSLAVGRVVVGELFALAGCSSRRVIQIVSPITRV